MGRSALAAAGCACLVAPCLAVAVLPSARGSSSAWAAHAVGLARELGTRAAAPAALLLRALPKRSPCRLSQGSVHLRDCGEDVTEELVPDLAAKVSACRAAARLACWECSERQPGHALLLFAGDEASDLL